MTISQVESPLNALHAYATGFRAHADGMTTLLQANRPPEHPEWSTVLRDSNELLVELRNLFERQAPTSHFPQAFQALKEGVRDVLIKVQCATALSIEDLEDLSTCFYELAYALEEYANARRSARPSRPRRGAGSLSSTPPCV
jgi:hypothetical protein